MQEAHIKAIYLDSASTTPIHKEIIKDVNTLMKDYYGNADSLHAMGQRVSGLVKQSRESLAKQLGVLPHEVIFTSGGSESNVSAIKGIAFANPDKKHIIASNVEHASVDDTLNQLETIFGYEVERLEVNKEGFVDVSKLKKALRSDTVLVAMMAINNEIGSIFPVSEYAQVIKKYSSAYFHVDAIQAITKIPFDMKQIDTVSISAHKLGGLKGSGLLIKKDRVPFVPLIPSGQQEFGIRGGTLDSISAIVFSKTLRLAQEDHDKHIKHIESLWKTLYNTFEKIQGIKITTPKNGTPYIFNLSIENVGSEIMMNALNSNGIYVSARSTCHSESNKPSRVLKAAGLSDKEALSSIRISLSSEISKEDIEKVIKVILETKDYVQH